LPHIEMALIGILRSTGHADFYHPRQHAGPRMFLWYR
jgi:hypothetical protein